MTLEYNHYDSPFGRVYIAADSTGVRKTSVTEEDWHRFRSENDLCSNPSSSLEAIRQLDEYFQGKRRKFQVRFSIVSGTAFQRKVWGALQEIPYGKTASYADIASAIDNPKAVRAVGQANRCNPLPIFIPCHRVIGKNGKLTGYAGSHTDLKASLLQLESVSRSS